MDSRLNGTATTTKRNHNAAPVAPKAAAAAAAAAAPSARKDNSVNTKYRYLKTPYTAGDHLPVITEPQAMLDDMLARILQGNSNDSNNGIQTLVQKLSHRPLRIATMCSGTESPLLALDMLQKSIRDACRDHPDIFGATNDDETTVFQLEHVFSCEIEPFKQAYIERNFHPPILFRDIRELGQDQAYTAYGALHPVPHENVDVLVAGTSCVDYSNLNNVKKNLEQNGESGSTFFGVRAPTTLYRISFALLL